MTTYRLMDGASGRPGVGSSGTQPPSAGTSYSGDYEAGLAFQVTSGGLWFGGYYWWVPATGGQTGAQKFALWQLTGGAAGTLVRRRNRHLGHADGRAVELRPARHPPAADPRRGLLRGDRVRVHDRVPGHQEPVRQHRPVRGRHHQRPADGLQQPHRLGRSAGDWLAQSPYSTATADPATQLPATNDDDDLLWLDVQVGTTAPSGATYRAFPNMPYPVGETAQSGAYTLGMEFSLSQACTLEGIWHYSAPSSAVLPSRCGIWNAWHYCRGRGH